MPHKPDSLVSDQMDDLEKLQKLHTRLEEFDAEIRRLAGPDNALGYRSTKQHFKSMLDFLSDMTSETAGAVGALKEAYGPQPKRVFAYQDMKGAAE